MGVIPEKHKCYKVRMPGSAYATTIQTVHATSACHLKHACISEMYTARAPTSCSETRPGLPTLFRASAQRDVCTLMPWWNLTHELCNCCKKPPKLSGLRRGGTRLCESCAKHVKRRPWTLCIPQPLNAKRQFMPMQVRFHEHWRE